MNVEGKRAYVCEYFASKIIEAKEKYRKYAGEVFFLEHGGDIMQFNEWWTSNCELDRWGLDLAEPYKPTFVEMDVEQKRAYVTQNLASKMLEAKEKYRKYAGEVYFLEHGGDIMQFNEWWMANCELDRWGVDLDVLDRVAYLASCPEPYKPTSVVTVCLQDNFSSIFDWPVDLVCRKVDAKCADNIGCSASEASTAHVTNSVNIQCAIPSSASTSSASTSSASTSSASTSRKCSAFNCFENDMSKRHLFKFPTMKGDKLKDKVAIERFGQWIKISGNRCLLSKSIGALSQHYYLCEKHFEDNCFSNNQKSRLLNDAVPTISSYRLSDHEVETYLKPHCIENGKFLTEAEENNYYASKFEYCMKHLVFFECEGCKERVLMRDLKTCIHGKRCINFQALNDMDPGDVPEELEDLTFIEEQLIARVHPVLSVYKLKGLQYCYCGNVINFSQDVAGFAKKLPHKIEDLPSILILKYQNEKCGSKFFNVRAGKILKALQWLKTNNKYYYDIEICNDNLNELPENGNVYDKVQQCEMEGNGDETCNDEDMCSNDSDVESDDREVEGEIHQSGVPITVMHTTEQQVESTILDWPEMNTTPVDEFNTEGYIACAFPTLFCRGYADLRSPRKTKINTSDYFQHLLNYKDGRFAKHSTFRFFALNSWMRWTACTTGSIMIKNLPNLKHVTVSRLKQMLNQDRSLMNKIIYQSSNIRGTKPFWSTRTGELVDMVEQLGLPTIFLTLSCADLHWPDLYRILTGKEDNSNLTEKQRRDLLQNNPYTVDSFFQERVECFIETILRKKFGVVDYWYRVEYQHRGSPHVHGIFWIEGAPDIMNIKPGDEEKLREAEQFFSKLITAINPNPNCECQGTHPCRTLYEDVKHKSEKDILEDLASLLVKCQRHTKCSEEYCIRAKKGGLKKCRFNFPHTLREEGRLYFDENGELQYEPARNDPLLNKLNELIMKIWRGNFDISPVLSKKLLLIYLSKYISKSEIRSSSLRDLFESVFGEFCDEDNVLKAIRRLYIRTCSERDYSAQEVCHILSGRKLFSAGGRKFVNVNLNTQNVYTKVVPDNVRKGKTVLEKYSSRPPKLDNESLFNLCKKYDISTSRYSKKAKENIVRVFPKLSLKFNDELDEEYYRVKVLLHVPWRNISDFEEMNKSWKSMYVLFKVAELENFVVDTTETVLDSDDDSENEEFNENDENLEEAMILSRMGPNQKTPSIDIGLRETDINFKWSQEAIDYITDNNLSLNQLENFIKIKKEEFRKSSSTNNSFDPNLYPLSTDQQAVLSQVNDQVQCILHAKTDDDIPRFTIVQGKAGTGKSYLINYLRWFAEDMLKLENCVLVLGPTGVSALNIRGQTLHAGLHIPVQLKDFKDLSGDTLKKFCLFMNNVKFLIIDEYSMVSCKMLRLVDLRCRQGKGINEPFGNLWVYMLGDIRQLPPVCGTALYKTPKEPGLAEQGKALIANVSKVFFLKQCLRQKDPLFQGILDRISTGDITREDYAILSTRFIYNVNNDERSKFKDAVHLYSLKKKVSHFNYESLKDLKFNNNEPAPVAKIVARHSNREASKATADTAQGLQHTVYLGKSSRIMLTNNLWTEMGLVNGAKGEVVHILYEDGEEPPVGIPKVIMCKFVNYNGPGIGPNNLVPIPAITKCWTSNGIQCSRSQFPLNLYYACSVHRSQGITEKKTYVDISEDEFSLGVSYVGFSRVKTLDGLLLKPFPYERLANLKNRYEMKERLSFELFLKKLSS